MNLFKTLFVVVVVALALVAGSQVAQAQSAPVTTDVYTVDYYSNANTAGAPDATVRVINPGTGSNTAGTAALDLCANIYVFDANQEMSECCSCFVSANALMTRSVNNNLTNNPLLGTLLHTGVIKIVSNLVNRPVCDPTTMKSSNLNLSKSNVNAAHIQNNVGTAFPIKVGGTAFAITEGESQAAGLGAGEQADLAEDCTVLRELGSGAGVCKCPPGH